jgi:hypothetical protein
MLVSSNGDNKSKGLVDFSVDHSVRETDKNRFSESKNGVVGRSGDFQACTFSHSVISPLAIDLNSLTQLT